MIDTHAHILSEFYDNIEDVILKFNYLRWAIS